MAKSPRMEELNARLEALRDNGDKLTEDASRFRSRTMIAEGQMRWDILPGIAEDAQFERGTNTIMKNSVARLGKDGETLAFLKDKKSGADVADGLVSHSIDKGIESLGENADSFIAKVAKGGGDPEVALSSVGRSGGKVGKFVANALAERSAPEKPRLR